MYTLIVKGDEQAAFAACDAHKVEITSIVKHLKFDECILTTPSSTPIGVLVDWFCEHSAADEGDMPYPAGTLVWYSKTHPAVFGGNLLVPDNDSLENDIEQLLNRRGALTPRQVYQGRNVMCARCGQPCGDTPVQGDFLYCSNDCMEEH